MYNHKTCISQFTVFPNRKLPKTTLYTLKKTEKNKFPRKHGYSNKKVQQKLKVYKTKMDSKGGFAGHRARVPPDPIPNSEVKPCSVSSGSVVLGHVNLGKLATHFSLIFWENYALI